jgi:two-component system phosphate regulon sensor histidine kinase PhoR
MSPLPELLVLLLVAFLLWVLIDKVVFPAKELLAVLQRIARGDVRPVILHGMPSFLRGAAKDLRETAETLASQKALLAEEEFSITTILESMTEGVAVTGADLRIRQVNMAAVSMFNLGARVNGMLLPEVFMSHELQNVARRLIQTGQVQRGALHLAIPGRKERCHLMLTAAPLNSSEKGTPGGFLFVFHDVTRLRELEAVRREFVANVSHEFRTPLSIINGYLETLADEEIDKEMVEKSVAVMRRHADRLNNLIEDLLTISRMEEQGVRLETRLVSVEPLLRGVIGQLEDESAERRVSVRLVIGEGIPDLQIDSYRMEQAFSNLLINALRHGVPLAAGEAGDVVVSVSTEGREVAVSFRDNGPGIPLQDQEHIFERFYRVGGDRARQTGGTGLGLSIVKNVVQAHGGRVTLESNPGEGSTFTIRLPFAV